MLKADCMTRLASRWWMTVTTCKGFLCWQGEASCSLPAIKDRFWFSSGLLKGTSSLLLMNLGSKFLFTSLLVWWILDSLLQPPVCKRRNFGLRLVKYTGFFILSSLSWLATTQRRSLHLQFSCSYFFFNSYPYLFLYISFSVSISESQSKAVSINVCIYWYIYWYIHWYIHWYIQVSQDTSFYST